MIRAEQLEKLVWNQVKEMVQNPELIVAGIDSLDAHDDSGIADRIAGAERDLQKVQVEEERAIRLYVSGKITEDQLDQQRRFITERLEAARAALNDLRARESMASEKRLLMENLIEWAGRFGHGLSATAWTTCPRRSAGMSCGCSSIRSSLTTTTTSASPLAFLLKTSRRLRQRNHHPHFSIDTKSSGTRGRWI